MKYVFMALVALVSISAQADIPAPRVQNIQRYEPKLATINPAHVAHPGASSFEINYTKNTVKMVIVREWYCPPKAACAMVMPEPLIVELPIVSIKEQNCGIKQVVALVDKRPVDGNLTQIKIQDISRLTCAFFAAVESKATYTTKSQTRGSKPSSATSKFILKLARQQQPEESEARTYEFTSGELLQGYEHRNEVPTSGSVSISDDTVELSVDISPNCENTRPCPMYMPPPIQAKLPIVSIEKSFCGDKIVALLDKRPVDGRLQKIEIVDYSNALCEKVILNLIELDYTTQGYDMRNGKEIKTKASFRFN